MALNYVYKSISIPGGGFVTGFVFHPTVENILYCRTDIGGCYRFNFETETWISLIDHATDVTKWETYPLGIALDRQNPSYVFTMVGDFPIHKIGFSKDYGQHWTYFDAPHIDEQGNTTWIHGNATGRSTGERIVVDPNNSDVLYVGTMGNGLWKTEDRCKTWTKLRIQSPLIPIKPVTNEPLMDIGSTETSTIIEPCNIDEESNIAFIEIDSYSSVIHGQTSRLIVSTNGQGGATNNATRGKSVYVSHDAGKTFHPIEGEPEPVLGGTTDYRGYVGQRAVFSEKYVFVTYAAYNIGWSSWQSYGCDTGLCYDGAVYRFAFDERGRCVEALDITPKHPKRPEWYDVDTPTRRIGYGMSGIHIDAKNPNVVVCSSICAGQDTIYRSTDHGETWLPIMSGLEIGEIDFTVSYHKPKYNGNNSLIHWMSDIKINPFNCSMAFFNTGTGVFITKNLEVADVNGVVKWSDCSFGMEETVHLNIYSPPQGDVKLIDIIGDYGGFAFKELDSQAENTFANATNDRWITAMNADYPDRNPQYLVVAPRGNWTGRTKGGIIVSYDQGDTWKQLQSPNHLTQEIDTLVEYLNTPNVTAGWVAVSANQNTILWGIGLPIYASTLVFTHDEGKNWGKSKVYDCEMNDLSLKQVPFKVMSDRVNPMIFYGFSDHYYSKGFYVSCDQGESFNQLTAPESFPKVNLAGIDSEQEFEIRVESDVEGVIWIALNDMGLWRLVYDSQANVLSGERVTGEDVTTKRIGLGKALKGSEFKTLYTSGTMYGEYGFFRSHDMGKHWIRVNDDATNFGDIRSISGDPRVFGRIYVATGTRGLVYGDESI